MVRSFIEDLENLTKHSVLIRSQNTVYNQIKECRVLDCNWQETDVL